MLGPPVVEIGSITLLVLPGDNETWSITVFAASADTALRGLRDPERFAAVVRACPLHAHWLNGDAITGVLPMAGILDRYRRLVVDDAPVATGVATVGDSWACTNPSAGRGISIGLIHAQILRDAVRNGQDDPERFVPGWDDATETKVAPWPQVVTATTPY
jgi:2-polyprenyl-6-methoxyphenol hydroxylase-like FAD-dependent oxidoreductase